MKLEEALSICSPNQFLYRKKWRDNGSTMKLSTSAKTLKEFTTSLILTDDSREADDWLIKSNDNNI